MLLFNIEKILLIVLSGCLLPVACELKNELVRSWKRRQAILAESRAVGVDKYVPAEEILCARCATLSRNWPENIVPQSTAALTRRALPAHAA